MRFCAMRKGISISVTAEDRVGLDAVVGDRNSPQKHVWRVYRPADRRWQGTVAITHAVGKDKRAVWRRQERFMREGIERLTRDKTRLSRTPRGKSGCTGISASPFISPRPPAPGPMLSRASCRTRRAEAAARRLQIDHRVRRRSTASSP